MKNQKIINQIIDYVKYHKSSVFDAIIDISEKLCLDIEDIVKSLDDNLLCELRKECIRDRKVLSLNDVINTDIESFFS